MVVMPTVGRLKKKLSLSQSIANSKLQGIVGIIQKIEKKKNEKEHILGLTPREISWQWNPTMLVLKKQNPKERKKHPPPISDTITEH